MADADSITRLNAALEGRYRIERELGAGGMATVYLAEDVRHHRSVAVKVLKPELAAVVGADRFLTEIETTANLQHPHILPLFDSGEADGFLFYVMPYVEGESLRDRLDREHQLPVDEAVAIATKVASALDYAHRHGVIHRDIKPANILLHDGEPVVADFGIALAVSAGGGDRLTETGLSLGTPHYMSPEQATGDQSVGPATDIYALGCVLYEMLVGEPPYTGSTPQAVLGRIITADVPRVSEERKSVPPNVEATVLAALEKIPADRFGSVADFGEALADPGFHYGSFAQSPRTRGESSAWFVYGGWAATAAVAALAIWTSTHPEASEPPEHLSIRLPEGQELAGAADMDISRDGSFIVYRGPGQDDGTTQLWTRRWDVIEGTPIPNTEGGWFPAISPSGGEVAFHGSSHDLVLVDLATGASRIVKQDDFTGAPSWSADGGWLYFSNLPGDAAIHRVSTIGSEIERVAEGSTAAFIWLPHLLPDGETVIYGAAESANLRATATQLQSVHVPTGEVKRLGAGWAPRFSQGYLLYVLDESLLAVPFDPETLEFTGPEVVLADNVGPPREIAPFSVSETGTVVYSPHPPPRHEMIWITRNGEVAPVEAGWTFDAGGGNAAWSLSPDGTRIAFRAATDDGLNIWVKQLEGPEPRRLTLGSARDGWPQWLDNETVAFTSDRSPDGGRDVWSKRVDGRGLAEIVYEPSHDAVEFVVGPSAVWLVSRTRARAEGPDLLTVRPGSDVDSLLPISSPESNEEAPAVSPDGRWLAYTSDRSGRREVWITSFPDGSEDQARQVSVQGAMRPVWSRDGSELFFVRINGEPTEFMRTEIDASAGLRIGTPEVLFIVPENVMLNNRRDFYDVTPDGSRFLMAREVEDATIDRELIRIRNFHVGLLEQVPN